MNKMSRRMAGKAFESDTVSRREMIDYIARMSQELTDMAYQADCKFVAYLLKMATMAAREEATREALENDPEECPC